MHEPASVNARAVTIFIACFIVTGAFVLFALWCLLGVDVRRQRRADAPPFPLGTPATTNLPQPLQPSPSHPTLPWQDLPALRDADLHALHTSGPLADDPAHLHIPIDRAMELLLQRGLRPATQPTTHPEQTDTRPATVENRT